MPRVDDRRAVELVAVEVAVRAPDDELAARLGRAPDAGQPLERLEEVVLAEEGRDVGRVDRDVELWEVWLLSRGLPVRLAEPLRGGKWDAATLEDLSGWTARTNQHGRDAARLVFGTTERHLEVWGVS